MTVKTRASFKADADDALPDNTVRSIRPVHVRTAFDDIADSATFQDEFALHTGDAGNPHATTKTQVGLGNADNTSDLDKPISTAAQAAIDLKAPLASPALTGTPTAPTPTMGDTSTKIATMAAIDAATNAAITGYQWKVPVETVATANITLSGEQTINGVLTSENRVAPTAQTDPAEVGIWVSAAGAWARATDMNTAAEFPHAAFLVNSGTLAGTQWKCTNTTNPVVDTDPITIIQVGAGLLLDFADTAEAVAGTDPNTVMAPSTAAAAIEGYAYDAARSTLTHSGGFPNPASNLERWRTKPLDIITDLNADGAGGDDEADTAAMEEFIACTASRGHGLYIPATPSGIRITRTLTFNESKNIEICGPSGGTVTKPSAYLRYVGAASTGMFDLQSVWSFNIRRLSLLNDASGVAQIALVRAEPGASTISSVAVTLEDVNFASVTVPTAASVWVRNSQQVTFRRCYFTQAQIACILGDITNVDGGLAAGGVGRVLFEGCYLAGDIQLRIWQGVTFLATAFVENQAVPTRGVQITDGGSGSAGSGLLVQECGTFGDGGIGNTESLCTLLRTYSGVRFEGNSFYGYRVGLDLFGTSGTQGNVTFKNNYIDLGDATGTPIGCRVNSTFGGTVEGRGTNTLSAATIADSGREFEDSRVEATQLALLPGVHASLGSNVTMTIGSNTTILTSSSVYANGGLYQIDATISVVNAAASTTIIFWLEFGGVELARTRAIHILASGQAVQIPFQAKVKCGPASGTFRIMGLQSSGTAAAVRGATAALGGQTQISAKAIDV